LIDQLGRKLSDVADLFDQLTFRCVRIHASSLGGPVKPPKVRLSRRTGRYLLEIKGRTIECESLKEMLAEGLRALEAYKKGTLDKLAAAKSRTRRIVSRDPSKLFDKTHLQEKHAEPLMEGWWYGTNNSALETNRWLRQARTIAGLTWEKDFSTTA
jgi:hypothetical protein